MPRGRLAGCRCAGLAVAVFLLITQASSAGTSSSRQVGLYIAVGDSSESGVARRAAEFDTLHAARAANVFAG
jgi:hypothetical protein